MSASTTVLLERDEAIVTLTLNRPDKLNALSVELVTELHRIFGELGADPSVRCAIITGAGDKAFAAGADIAAMASMTPQQAKHFADLGHRVGAAVEALHFPVIAAVNGFALGGGCEIALACDFIYASDKAKLGQPEVNLGVIPGFGGTQRLARRVGDARARELCMTGDMVGADEALRIGLVNRVLPPNEFLPAAHALALRLASGPAFAHAMTKQMLESEHAMSLDQAIEAEAQAQAICMQHPDFRTSFDAWRDKRPIRFAGAPTDFKDK